MGKETKIGMVVIALLLCVLGGVIVKRMTGGDKLVGFESKGKDKSKQTETTPKPATTQTQTTNKPTLLETKSGTSRPPVTPSKTGNSDRWSSSSSRRRTGATDSSTAYNSKGTRGYSSGRYDSNSNNYASGYQRGTSSQDSTTANQDAPYSPYRRQFNASDSLAGQDPPQPLMTPGQDYRDPTSVNVEQGPALHRHGDNAGTNPLRGQAVDSRTYNPYQRTTGAAAHEHSQHQLSHSPYRNSATRTTAVQQPMRTSQFQQTRPVSQGLANSGNLRFSSAQPITPEPSVEMRENTGKYYVEPGDSYWIISQKMYGEGGFFKALEAHNRGRIPKSKRLQVGDEIETPDIATLRQRYAGICPKERVAKRGTPRATNVSASLVSSGRSYVVEEGDTLFDIARYELGDPQRWPEIYQLNRQVLGEDIDFVRPGISLILPGKPGAEAPPIQQRQDVLTRQPGQRIYR